MKACTVFHDGAILLEEDNWIPTTAMPDGSYTRFDTSVEVHWYAKRWGGSCVPINTRDVPNDVRLMLMLLDVPL